MVENRPSLIIPEEPIDRLHLFSPEKALERLKILRRTRKPGNETLDRHEFLRYVITNFVPQVRCSLCDETADYTFLDSFIEKRFVPTNFGLMQNEEKKYIQDLIVSGKYTCTDHFDEGKSHYPRGHFGPLTLHKLSYEILGKPPFLNGARPTDDYSRGLRCTNNVYQLVLKHLLKGGLGLDFANTVRLSNKDLAEVVNKIPLKRPHPYKKRFAQLQLF